MAFFPRPSLLLKRFSYPKKSKTSDVIEMEGVPIRRHPLLKFWLGIYHMVKGIHIPESHVGTSRFGWKETPVRVGSHFLVPITTREKPSIFQGRAFWCPSQFKVDPTKTPNDGTWLGRTSSEVFVMLVVVFHSFLLFILLLFFICCSSSFISRLLYHATGTPPWILRPVKASTGAGLYPGYFWLPFDCFLATLATFDCFFIYRERYGFEWAFFTHPRFFTLRSFPGIFCSACVYEGLPGSRQFFLEVCRASWWS